MCPNPACTVRLFCVQCLGSVKYSADAPLARKLSMCRCSNPLSGEACFNKRWADIWQPVINSIGRGLAKSDRPTAEQQIQALIVSDERSRTFKGGDDWVLTFKRKSLLHLLDQIQGLEQVDQDEARRLQTNAPTRIGPGMDQPTESGRPTGVGAVVTGRFDRTGHGTSPHRGSVWSPRGRHP